MAKKGFKPIFTLDQLAKRGITIINDNGLFKGDKKDNRKVKSIPTVFNGIKYKSKLEAFFAKEMTFRGIPFEYEAISFQTIEGFKYNGEKIQGVKYTPDFSGKGWLVEIKGRANEQFSIRKKLFLKYLVDNDIIVDYRILKTEPEILDFINQKFSK